jgi:hypothetical protein
MRKKYKYPKTKKLIKRLKPFLLTYKLIEERYWKEICKLEESMQELTKISEIEFIFCDNEFVGIGNLERTMELIHKEEIENAK